MQRTWWATSSNALYGVSSITSCHGDECELGRFDEMYIWFYFIFLTSDAISKSAHVINGTMSLGTQYHFSMETQVVEGKGLGLASKIILQNCLCKLIIWLDWIFLILSNAIFLTILLQSIDVSNKKLYKMLLICAQYSGLIATGQPLVKLTHPVPFHVPSSAVSASRQMWALTSMLQPSGRTGYIRL